MDLVRTYLEFPPLFCLSPLPKLSSSVEFSPFWVHYQYIASNFGLIVPPRDGLAWIFYPPRGDNSWYSAVVQLEPFKIRNADLSRRWSPFVRAMGEEHSKF